MSLRLPKWILTSLVFCLFLTGQSFAQQIEGLISDETHQPISQAHILNLTKGIGTVSDSSGYFKIKASEADLLSFSAIAFQKDSLRLDSSLHFNRLVIIRLNSKEIALNEVVLVGRPFSMIDTTKKDFGPIDMNLPFPNHHIRKPALDRQAAFLKPKIGVGTLISSLNGSYRKLEILQNARQEQRDIELMRSQIEDSLFVDMGIAADDVCLFLDFVFHRNKIMFRRQIRSANIFDKLSFLQARSKAFLRTKE